MLLSTFSSLNDVVEKIKEAYGSPASFVAKRNRSASLGFQQFLLHGTDLRHLRDLVKSIKVDYVPSGPGSVVTSAKGFFTTVNPNVALKYAIGSSKNRNANPVIVILDASSVSRYHVVNETVIISDQQQCDKLVVAGYCTLSFEDATRSSEDSSGEATLGAPTPLPNLPIPLPSVPFTIPREPPAQRKPCCIIVPNTTATCRSRACTQPIAKLEPRLGVYVDDGVLKNGAYAKSIPAYYHIPCVLVGARGDCLLECIKSAGRENLLFALKDLEKVYLKGQLNGDFKKRLEIAIKKCPN